MYQRCVYREQEKTGIWTAAKYNGGQITS